MLWIQACAASHDNGTWDKHCRTPITHSNNSMSETEDKQAPQAAPGSARRSTREHKAPDVFKPAAVVQSPVAKPSEEVSSTRCAGLCHLLLHCCACKSKFKFDVCAGQGPQAVGDPQWCAGAAADTFHNQFTLASVLPAHPRCWPPAVHFKMGKVTGSDPLLSDLHMVLFRSKGKVRMRPAWQAKVSCRPGAVRILDAERSYPFHDCISQATTRKRDILAFRGFVFTEEEVRWCWRV